MRRRCRPAPRSVRSDRTARRAPVRPDRWRGGGPRPRCGRCPARPHCSGSPDRRSRGNRAREGEDPGLGCGVGLIAQMGQAVDRAEVDDDTALGLQHHRKHLLATQEGAEQVDLEVVAQLLDRGVQQSGTATDHRIVDQDVDPTEGLRGRRHHGPDRLDVADVDAHRDRAGQLSGSVADAVDVDVGERDPRAGLGEALCCSAADAGRGTGDDHGTVGELACGHAVILAPSSAVEPLPIHHRRTR